jgi:hypothetical protein
MIIDTNPLEGVLRQPGGHKNYRRRGPDSVQGILARARASLEADLERLAGERSTGAPWARPNGPFDSTPRFYLESDQ